MEHASVSATLRLPKLKEPIKIKRLLKEPNELICEDFVRSHLEPILDLASRGQHVLTRRELLKYVTAEAGKRATEIQALLGITEIENIRRAFVKVKTATKAEVSTKSKNVEGAKGSINATVRERRFDHKIILKIVNNNRTILGGKPISTLNSKFLKKGTKPLPVINRKQTLNITVLSVDIANLQDIFTGISQSDIAQQDSNLRGALQFVHAQPELRQALKLQELTKQGLELLNDTENCPLCDTSWPPGKLRKYLENRLAQAKVADDYRQRITIYRKFINDSLTPILSSLKKVISAAELVKLHEDAEILKDWQTQLENLEKILLDPVNKYLNCGYDVEQIKIMLANGKIEKAISNVNDEVQAQSPQVTPEQTALEMLTRLEVELKTLEDVTELLENAENNYKRAEKLILSFEKARDKILGQLYGEIKSRFEELYRHIHGSDESEFVANFEPDGPGLKLEVDFYGRGIHPPHALLK